MEEEFTINSKYNSPNLESMKFFEMNKSPKENQIEKGLVYKINRLNQIKIRFEDISDINEINNKCVEFILEDNSKIALKLLKKAFSLIEVF